MESVKRIDFQFLGDRNYPVAFAKMAGPLAESFPELYEKARKINPAISVDEVVRQVFDLGVRKLHANIARGILQEPRSAQTGT
jgi:hypothetical protein